MLPFQVATARHEDPVDHPTSIPACKLPPPKRRVLLAWRPQDYKTADLQTVLT